MKSREHNSAISIVEILVVVAIIAVLAGIISWLGGRTDDQTKAQAVEATFAVLEGALQEYYDFKGSFPVAADVDPHVNCEILYAALSSVPGSRNVLDKLSDKLIANKFNVGAAVPVQEIYDPWGTVLDYRYNAGDAFPKLVSAGPDRDFTSTGDNITNR